MANVEVVRPAGALWMVRATREDGTLVSVQDRY